MPSRSTLTSRSHPRFSALRVTRLDRSLVVVSHAKRTESALILSTCSRCGAWALIQAIRSFTATPLTPPLTNKNECSIMTGASPAQPPRPYARLLLLQHMKGFTRMPMPSITSSFARLQQWRRCTVPTPTHPPHPCPSYPRPARHTRSNPSGNNSGNKIGKIGNAGCLLPLVPRTEAAAPSPEKISPPASHPTSFTPPATVPAIPANNPATIPARTANNPATKSAKTAMSRASYPSPAPPKPPRNPLKKSALATAITSQLPYRQPLRQPFRQKSATIPATTATIPATVRPQSGHSPATPTTATILAARPLPSEGRG